jgi:hypothetical protein
LCHTWCDAFRPINEAFFIPETFQFIVYTNERKVTGVFNAKRQHLSTQRTNFDVPTKCLQASCDIFLLAAKYKTSHSVVEELVIFSANGIPSIMFQDKISAKIKAIPSADNTVHGRIVEMAAHVTDKVVVKALQARLFIRSSTGWTYWHFR